MGGRWGYEYSYGFWRDDEIIPRYSRQLSDIKHLGCKGFLFEIRTDFKLKSRVDDDAAGQNQTMMLGSERFGASVPENDDEEWWLEGQIKFRLKDDYWMPDDEIQSLVRDALAFAKQRAEEDKSFSFIGVVVGLDVWTVQQEGEEINKNSDRAIRPECLFPLHLCLVGVDDDYQVDEYPYLERKGFLMELPRIRVEDEAGLALMEVCPVCSRDSTIGAQISFLPCLSFPLCVRVVAQEKFVMPLMRFSDTT